MITTSNVPFLLDILVINMFLYGFPVLLECQQRNTVHQK